MSEGPCIPSAGDVIYRSRNAEVDTEGTVPDAFFDQVNSRVALVSSPAELWASARSARIRQYFARRQIPVYVSDVHGQIQVVIDPSGFSILPEFSIKA